jgi:ABC-type sulfate transport system permease component
MITGLFSSSSYSLLLVVDLTLFILYRLIYILFRKSYQQSNNRSNYTRLLEASSAIHSLHATDMSVFTCLFLLLIIGLDTSLSVEQVKYQPAKYF